MINEKAMEHQRQNVWFLVGVRIATERRGPSSVDCGGFVNELLRLEAPWGKVVYLVVFYDVG